MQVVFRNKKLLEKSEKEKHRLALIKFDDKIKRLYPMLYEEVGSKNVRKILRAVFRSSKKNKVED